MANDSIIVEELKAKIKVIQQCQKDKANQDGQMAQLLKQLKDEGNVDSILAAEEVLEKLSEEHAGNVEVLKTLGTKMDKIISIALSGSGDSDTDSNEEEGN